MSVARILEDFRDAGIELETCGDQLRVRTFKERLTQDQLKVLKENKISILECLLNKSSELKPPSEVGSCPITEAENLAGDNDGILCKRPNGQIVSITKDEFSNIVQLFRLLHHIDVRSKK